MRERLAGDQLDAWWQDDVVTATEHDAVFAQLQALPDWVVHRVQVYGKTHNAPRLSAWYGEPGCVMSYSGLRLTPLPWPTLLAGLRRRVEAVCGVAFNAVLANYYRDGSDRMGWHCDDEPELGRNPAIASLSFGCERDFQLRRIDDHSIKRSIPLGLGRLLFMGGNTQHYWHHALPVRKRQNGPRINLTFRNVITEG